MPSSRFNLLFAVLMLGAFASAFFVPQQYTRPLAAGVRGVFTPITFPIRWIAVSLSGGLFAPPSTDLRLDEDIRRENDSLRTELVRISDQLQRLQAINADRALLGDLRNHSIPLAVVGGDSGNRQTLLLRPLLSAALANDLPVICPAGLVGRLDRVGAAAGPMVRLVTDPGFRVEAGFRRLITAPDGKLQVAPLASPPQLVEGGGAGKMYIRTMSDRQVEQIGLKIGDWVVLSDRDYAADLQGLKIGKITSITPRPDAQHFSLIELEPMQNLALLREVMVFRK